MAIGPQNIIAWLPRLFVLALLLAAAFFVLRPDPDAAPLPPEVQNGKGKQPHAEVEEPPTPRPSTPEAPEETPPVAEPGPAANTRVLHYSSAKVAGVTVRDREGQVVFDGTVDLGPTLARIQAGEKLRFPDDGIVFRNREQKLPAKASGYYHEYVHPTPDVRGPGPQRVIVGGAGEVYYTPDHYRTFTKLP